MSFVVRIAIVAVGLMMLGCGSSTARVATTPARESAAARISEADLRWLGRITFGVDTTTVERYRQLGRARFLEEQLHPAPSDPPDLAAVIAAIPIAQSTAEQLVYAVRAEQQRINALATDEEKQQGRMALNQRANQASYDTAKRHLMRALYSPTQLREQMTWFWMNHFNVFSGKGNVRWTLPEYEEQVIRPRALGRFHDLVLATATAPAMLEYLDNAQSAANKINENYARELMELHTLGVSGGASGSRYTQQDVQELARVLTGVGLNVTPNTPKIAPARQVQYVRRGLFEFHPGRHDFGQKTVLGRHIGGAGLPEVEQAVTALCEQPATARFISRKLATYFSTDEPPSALVDAMTTTFTRTHGDIAAVLRTMFQSQELMPKPGAPDTAGKLKDPLQFVISSLRLAYDGKVVSNYRPIVGWLTQLGEPLYGRVTPDGYALVETAWTSSGQMVRRFEIARAIGSGSAGLFNTDDGKPGPRIGFPMLTNRLFYDAIEPTLGARTRAALANTASQQEWNTVLLASPDWMLR